MQIYVHRDGQQLGPYTPEQVQQDVAAGRLNSTDLAWHDGVPNWVPLAQLPGVVLPPPPPPAVTVPNRPAPTLPAGHPAAQPGSLDAATIKKYKQAIGARGMKYGALWCIGGTVVTVWTYSAAESSPSGGHYFVAWGAIIFGGIQFVRGLITYLRA